MKLSPINIRPHLIPFLIKELSGVEVFIEKKHIKICKIENSSSLGFLFKLVLNEEDFNTYAQFKFFFKLDKSNIKFSKGMIYMRIRDNKFRCVRVLPEKAKKINDILEDVFRISFNYFIKGYLQNDDDIRKGVDAFMLQYELDEYEYEEDQMEKIFMRGKDNMLNKLCYLSKNIKKT